MRMTVRRIELRSLEEDLMVIMFPYIIHDLHISETMLKIKNNGEKLFSLPTPKDVAFIA